MNIDDIERLVRLVADTGVGEVEIKMGGAQLRISRLPPAGESARPEVHLVSMPSGAPGAWPGSAPAYPPAAAPLAAAPSMAAPAARAPEEEGLHVVKASMVGTFYRRPNPEAPPYVKEGDVIKKGQVICILEAMKIMNEIESDMAGTVVGVFADDGQPVEYGEKLIAIRPL